MQEEQQLAAQAAQQRREAELRAVRQEAGRQAKTQEVQLASCSSALAQERQSKEEAMAACAEAHQQLVAMQVRACGRCGGGLRACLQMCAGAVT
jgi:hypothetical protein